MSPRRLDPAWTAPLLFLVLGFLFLAIPLYKAATRPDCTSNKDYTFWWQIGQDVRADKPLYAPMWTGEVKYMYPPTLAVLVYAPLTHLGPVGFVLAVGGLSACAWAVAVWASMVLISGRWPGHPRWVYILPGAAVGTYVWDIQVLGQINLVLLALLLLSMVALHRGWKLSAGLLFAASAAMKAFPLTAICYFVVRREWKATIVALVGVAAFVWFLPGCVRGFDRIGLELRQWAGHMVADQSGQTMSGRTTIGFTRRNHSLVSVSHRLLRDVNAGDNATHDYRVNFANVSPGTAQWIGYTATLVLGAVLLLACRFRFATSVRAEGLEVAMVCCLVVLASPLSFTYFYCWLLPAWTAMALLWNDADPAVRRMVRAGGLLAGVLLASAVTEQFTPMLQAYGVTTWGTVTLFLTLALVRWRTPNAGTQAVPVPLRRAA